MYTNQRHNFYLRGNPLIIPSRWDLIRQVGKDKISPDAQLKLEWIIFYHTIGEKHAKKTAVHFGISRKTLHKWLKRFIETRPETLEEFSRTPHKTRQRDISPLQRIRIVKLRTKHIKWGKMKLQRRYLRVYGAHISSWKIQKVIEETNLYPDKTQHKKEQRKRKQAQINPKKRITDLVKKNKVHYLWHVDTVLLTRSLGGYYYLLTAIDEVSKLAYARLYKTHSSRQAADFLKRLHYLTEGEIINLHHDNGSEFEKDFKKACIKLSLPQWYYRVKTPKDNPVLERFNRTIQEDFVEMTPVAIDEIKEFNQELTEWLIEYNSIRPHETLDYLTPLEYIDIHFKSKVLPMSSSSTAT
jgi:transposase InsO family protein